MTTIIKIGTFCSQALVPQPMILHTATGIPWSHGLQLNHGKYQLHSWQIIPDWKYHFRNQERDQPFVVSIVVSPTKKDFYKKLTLISRKYILKTHFTQLISQSSNPGWNSCTGASPINFFDVYCYHLKINNVNYKCRKTPYR